MKRCPNCNASMNEDETACPICGETMYRAPQKREGCFVFAFLEFFTLFIPFLGIFLYILFRNTRPRTSRILLITSIIATIFWVLVSLFVVIVGIDIIIAIFSGS